MSWINKEDIIKQYGNKDYPKIQIDGSLVDDDEKVEEAIIQGELYFRQNLEAINIDTSVFSEPQVEEIKMYLLDYTRWIYSNKDTRMTNQIFERFKIAKKWLSDVKKGTVVLINIEQDKSTIQNGFSSLGILRV